ncbi:MULTISPECIES: hypothetical protein [Erysipelotrichaceae]|uniref:hypothetical protein n=1 Tax=Erysipelotrichaceae TaxID=128827 RepID=UPI00272BF14A|nr:MULTISPECIES: hypothetical protein [Erysipelotrichaceae]
MDYRIVKINVTQDLINCQVVTGTCRIYSLTILKDGGVIAHLRGGRVANFPVVKHEFRLPPFAEETLRKAESSGIGFYKSHKEAEDRQYVRDEMVDMILDAHGLQRQPELAEDTDLLKGLCRIDARFSLGPVWNDRGSSDWQAMEEIVQREVRGDEFIALHDYLAEIGIGIDATWVLQIVDQPCIFNDELTTFRKICRSFLTRYDREFNQAYDRYCVSAKAAGLELSFEEAEPYAKKIIALDKANLPARELSKWLTFEEVLKDRVLSFEGYRKISDAYDRLVIGDEGIDGDIIAAVEEKLLSKQDIQLLTAIADGKVDPETTEQRIDFTEKNPYLSYGLDTEMEMEF